MDDELLDRVETLERAVTDGDHDFSGLTDDTAALERLESLEDHLEEIDEEITELKAATQALRGYVGNIRAVNEDVENTAEKALSKVERLEQEVGRAPTDCQNRATRSRPTPETHQQASTGAGQSTTSNSTPTSTQQSHKPHNQSNQSSQAERRHQRAGNTGTGTVSDGGTNAASGDPKQRDNSQAPQQITTQHTPESAHHCESCGQKTSSDSEESSQSVHASDERAHTYGGDNLGSVDAGSNTVEQAAKKANEHAGSTHTTTETAVSQSAETQFEGLREDDPLVSDNEGTDASALARFRNLL